MNEKIQTQIIGRPGPVQRGAACEGSALEIQKEIAALKAEEEALFCQRGYGGYINTERLEQNRAKRAALQSGPAE